MVARTAATRSLSASACWRVPATNTTKSSAYVERRIMPSTCLGCRDEQGSRSGARHNPVLVCGSEGVEEGQDGVGGAVASGGAAGWCGAGEGTFFDGHVGVEVGLGGLGRFVDRVGCAARSGFTCCGF